MVLSVFCLLCLLICCQRAAFFCKDDLRSDDASINLSDGIWLDGAEKNSDQRKIKPHEKSCWKIALRKLSVDSHLKKIPLIRKKEKRHSDNGHRVPFVLKS